VDYKNRYKETGKSKIRKAAIMDAFIGQGFLIG
jgi:hypothetical protein